MFNQPTQIKESIIQLHIGVGLTSSSFLYHPAMPVTTSDNQLEPIKSFFVEMHDRSQHSFCWEKDGEI